MSGQPIDVTKVHPARVAAGLPKGLPEGAIARLIACRRLSGRLAGTMVVPASAGEGALPPSTSTASTESFPHPMTVALHAGAAWHAATLRAILTRQDRAVIIGRIGEPAYRFGLSQPYGDQAARLRGDASAVALAVETDGLSLLGRWLRHESRDQRLAILMRLPPGTPAETDDAPSVRDADDEAIITAALDHLATVPRPEPETDARHD